MQKLNMEWVPISVPRPYKSNPRVRSRKAQRALEASMRTNGITQPIVVDEANEILAGHGRYEAAVTLGLETVPIVRVTHLTKAQKAAYRIADNKIASMSNWDLDLLPGEFEIVLGGGLSIDTTAFEIGEADALLERHAEAQGGDCDPIAAGAVEASAKTTVTKPGAMWILGNHRILCGDTTDPQAVARLMQGEQARMAFIDPPYNVQIHGFAVGRGATHHPEFAMASGEMSPDEFVAFLTTTMGQVRDACVDGAIIYACIDWRHIEEMLRAGRALDLDLLNLIVWVKTNGGMGTFYRSQHELICAFKNGKAPHLNTFGLGERFRTNVWEYRGANAFGAGRADDLADHPTVKPARMVADAIKDVSHRGDIVVDFFGGSGTTLLAAQMTGRKARLMEISPAYVDVAVRRWQKSTGKLAIDAESGREFDALAAENGALP